MAFYKYAIVETKEKYCFYLYLSLSSTDWNSYNSFAINDTTIFRNIVYNNTVLKW